MDHPGCPCSYLLLLPTAFCLASEQGLCSQDSLPGSSAGVPAAEPLVCSPLAPPPPPSWATPGLRFSSSFVSNRPRTCFGCFKVSEFHTN